MLDGIEWIGWGFALMFGGSTFTLTMHKDWLEFVFDYQAGKLRQLLDENRTLRQEVIRLEKQLEQREDRA